MVVVNCQVREPFICAAAYSPRYEGRCQRTVPVFPRDVVHAIPSQADFSNQKPPTSRCLDNTTEENCSVFFVVTGKEMAEQAAPIGLGRREGPWLHCVRIHSSTFNSLIAAVSAPCFQFLDLRETCTTWVRFQVVFDMPLPNWAPPTRRGLSTKK